MKSFFNSLNFKTHLLTAISYLIPVVCGAGFMIAIGMAFGGDSSADLTKTGYSFWDVLAVIGGLGLKLLPVIIATGISYSIADKPGIAPGVIIGLTSTAVGADFIGGIIGGFLTGYLVLLIIQFVKLPSWAKGLMPMLVIPFIASLVGGLIMVYIIGVPIGAFTHWLTEYLQSLNGTSKLFYGLLIGVLASIDFGGPINKTVFAFVLTLQAQGIHEPITALIVVNTATPLGFALAYWVAKIFKKNIYKQVEVETLKTAFPMGLIEIVEGVLPLALNDIIRSVVATGIGGAVGGAISMVLGGDAQVPFGGLLVLPTMSQPFTFVLAVLANVIVTALVLTILKKPIDESNDIKDETEEDEIDLNELKIT
ncbi:PTS fructose transporter subunit IIC [Staphylococcus shinii]|uniref:PTS fructose transporter subunit IIC n=1 Tax=Staphylococcus shinii TaxID=2912228 RepID=A0A418IE61_9STAP|nr:PTS fructose transporter subunit IIC [Staphylococcus shinii]MDW8563573.1 PTS fructose transporter subunit IIC [Staphylococcus shinii]MDW8566814.1 PTS fructose transporter subunit IIC [Staphylococcus shinii]PTI66029.1 PTS fructose transporter subunit IIC [Staphylococcus shinii]RIM99516.1 PTS fructose transporter subunit IIC [Staphylococcus shinii]RIN10232.1 PTS fructose transporter subunit IIC [Staphylococcus shinii]